ncbi:hypothetical protein [Chryseobacterium nematophagum]|uniref:hypothetical protein n=1 Tax=Chryseobacterium nematophagum TaxID=2305228 RepID=UPI001604E021|nr:hypothetical protein [Chryseobacterium nematophagum]
MNEKEVKNLKGYRQKPTIYGLNTIGFLVSAIISIVALLSLLSGVSIIKLIIITVIIAVTYFTSLILSNNSTINEWLFDEKLPEKFSDDE